MPPKPPAATAARLLYLLCCALLPGPALPQTAQPPDALLEGFRNPPQAAKPRVWWHWMNGNITKEGIRRDIDWMTRVGIGGIDAIDASIDTPQVVKDRLIYMTPPWRDAFRYTADLADKMGLELSIDSSPGWSETGGPWVTPQQAMKKLVWSRTEVDGGISFHGVLAQPPANSGPFQNLPKGRAPDFYRDSIVIAYRMPVAEMAAAVTSNASIVGAASLGDGDLTNGPTLRPGAADEPVWIQFAYAEPARIQGVTLALFTNDGLGFAARVQASDDGRDWHPVIDLPRLAQVRRFALPQQTISFAPVTARFFRIVIRPDAPIPNSLRIVERASGTADVPAPPATDAQRFYKVSELVLHAAATINEFEKKAGFAIARDNYAIAGQTDTAPGSMVNPGDGVTLTDRMKPDGTLDWTPPPGRWVVLRMGYSLTGTENHPATAEATGLEVDKLNRAHVRDYMNSYLDTYARATGPALFGKRGLTALTVDSTEVGAQNWTESILADFRRLRGYDPTPWLPALTGMLVKSAADSDRFLWDFRRTINQLLAENHYGEIARISRQRGLTSYIEALEDNRPTFGDDLEMRRHADIPMAAMWSYVSGPRPTYIADIQGAASVAHVYGQKLVAAESLTSAGQPWALGPRALKPVVDLEFVLGVNRVVIHTSVHQPVEAPPGLSLNAYGQFFNRLESWVDLAEPWMRYIARCSWLLQQGHHAADVAYFPGEEAPITGLFGDAPVSDVPKGYGFDFVGPDAVLNMLSVDRGALVTKSGMRYRVLYLGGSSRLMTLPVLRRIRDLVARGAVLVGRPPGASPSLADDRLQFHAVADELFSGGDVHAFGAGRVFASGSLAAAFATLNIPPDFEHAAPQADTEILALHRHLADGELYFVTNRRDRPENVTATFRVTGLKAEIWNAVSGEIVAAPVTQAGERSSMALALPAYGSAFVVFRKTSNAKPQTASVTTLATLEGPWDISFQQGRGAPARVTQASLASWSENTDAGVKYFSGKAVYARAFLLPQAKPGTRLMLDLGEVREIAEVSLNGKRVGAVWTPPFTLDITQAARAGRNVLKIEVANLWVNRLIGDAQPGQETKYTFTTIPTYRADAPLRPSGLLGPVQIRQTAPAR